MTAVVLKAEKREKLGSLQTKKIKRAGQIPAIIYSKNGNINLSIDAKEFEHEYFKGNAKSSVIELEIAGKKTKVIAHNIDLDPVSDRPIHVDFLNCADSKTIKAQPKLDFINQDKSVGLKKGGVLHVVLRKVVVICDSESVIPTKIDVDVAALQVGQKIRGSDLSLPKGVKLAKKPSFLIASIIGRTSKDDAAATTTATPAAAATPAPAADAKKSGVDKK